MGEDDDFDADAFAARANGETPTDGHAAAEGAEPSSDVGSESTLREMLLATGPERSLEDVESPWNPDLGGETRIFRGIQKATDVDGLPAIADVLIGLAELVQRLDFNDGSDDAGDAGDDQDASADLGASIDG
jgi:hypothetical protein